MNRLAYPGPAVCSLSRPGTVPITGGVKGRQD
jgi:hypothetical protein